jgi:hypothetical protein
MDIVASYQDKLDAYGYVPIDHDEPNFFPVALQDIFDGSGNTIEGSKRLVRTDTNETLKVHSDGYGLISYEDSFAKFDEELNRSGLNVEDMVVATDMSHNGSRCFRQYVLPKHSIDLPTGGSLALRFLMFNSYDGSTKFRGRAGGYSFVCANTCVLGTDIINIGVKHTKNAGLQIEGVIEQVVASADQFITWGPKFEEWAETRPSRSEVYHVLTQLPFSVNHIDAIFRSWVLDEADSLLGVYNAITSWSTFNSTGVNKASARADREARVATLIEGNVWNNSVGGVF